MNRTDTLLRLKRFRVDEMKRRIASIEAMKVDLERKLTDLDDNVAREKQRAGDSDIGRLAFPSFLRSVEARRENLRITLKETEREMTAAQNVDGVTRTWDDKVVWYDLMPAEIDDRKAAIARIADQFKPIKNLRTKILRMSVDTGGELGYAFSTQEFIADKKDGGPGLDFIFRETDIFKKKAGQWRLIHQQLSVPIDLATGQAVFTSKDWLVSTSKSN